MSSNSETSIERLLANFKDDLNLDEAAYSEHDLESDYPGWLEHVWKETELCKDRTKRPGYCLNRRVTNRCWTPEQREHTMMWCANTCGYCNCRNWKNHCCPDEKTRADGPAQKGCPKKLCYDKWVGYCPQAKAEGGCDRSAKLRDHCAWSCNQCHRPAPSKLCQGPYGCCWDGRRASGPNKKGCRECKDYTPHICSIWGANYCDTGSYKTTWFMQRYCPGTCGLCGDCYDKIGSSACRRKMRVYKSCNHGSLKRDCARYCGLCKKRSLEADSAMGIPWK